MKTTNTILYPPHIASSGRTGRATASLGRCAVAAAVFLLAAALEFPLSAQEDRWKELNAQVMQLYQRGKYTEAVPIAQEAVQVAEAAFGSDHPNVATSLNFLANLYHLQGKYTQAQPLYQRALGIDEKALGPEHPYVATSLYNMAALYKAQGKYAEAEPLYLRSLAIREKALGPNHPDVASSLNNLAALYYSQGKYAEAEPLYQRSIAITEKAQGPDNPHLATLLSNLASLYLAQGKYSHAEPLLKRALGIVEKVFGPNHPVLVNILNNLAAVSSDQGKHPQAESLYQRALAIQEKALGPEHPSLATILNNLAFLYHTLGRYSQAEPLYQHSLAIQQKALGPQHPDVAHSLNFLAGLYADQGKYVQAEPLFLLALAIRERALGSEHGDVANSLSNLASLYYAQGKLVEAESLSKRGLTILEKALGPDHPKVGVILINLALLYYSQGLPNQAEPHFDRCIQNLVKQFEQHFSYMSEKERLGFLDTVSSDFPAYFSFCLTYREQLADLAGKMYDVVLWHKGFIAQSVAAVRAQIETSGDRDALALLDQLTAKKTQLAHLLTSEPKNPEAWRKQIAQLEEEANDLEKELVRRSAGLAEQKTLARVTWRDVQKALKPGEAAVEFLRFRYHDGKKWTETTYYVALVVTPESTMPGLIVLGEAKNFEKAPLRQYRAGVGLARGEPAREQQPPAEGEKKAPVSFFDAFWKPLEPALTSAKRIYLSPDGVLNQVSLGVVPDADGKLLIERYDLRVVNSTKDLLRDKRATATAFAVLIGNPAFDLNEATQRTAARSLQKSGVVGGAPVGVARGSMSRELRGGALLPLPATQVELEQIAALLGQQKWQVQLYTDQQALKESIKRVRQPRVLHVATHGFFLPDQERKLSDRPDDRPSGLEDPMLRSGLFFAGANRTLAGQPTPPDLDDGILTAYEATGLNLQGTELVVLSACETGLGQVAAGEGVFGLRRALQVAGADAVLMSMWSVPDRETQELMTLFYTKWLAGKDKHQALREAQVELRETVKARYGQDLPYYWGAFVLVGR